MTRAKALARRAPSRWVAALALAAGPACSPTFDESHAAVGDDNLVPLTPIADANVATDNGWPRTFPAGDLQITMYQPQVDSWQDDRIQSRAAVSVKTTASAAPIFGVVWLSARTDVDRENRLVTLDAIQVERASFPSETERGEELAAAVREHMPRGGVMVALDRLEASLAATRAESSHPTVHVRNDVPRVVVSTTPALLVLVDGQPVRRSVADTSLDRVINTRALLLFDRHGGRYYLCLADRWMTSSELAGPWTEDRTIEPQLSLMLERAKTAASGAGLVDLLDTAGTPVIEDLARGTTPAIYVSTLPTELIETTGTPQLQAISGTRLLEVTNTKSDVFFDTVDQRYYVLLSGRWFRSASLEGGPWEFVPAKKLPLDFAQIPENHPKGTVRASIPGTAEAEEAIIANGIPQTATVVRSQAQLTVAYDGTPQWAPIEETALARAINAATPVIRVNPTRYYAVEGGVWFTADAPTGPWTVASSVPDVVYGIPASSPLYNVTYVRVYEATPETVYEGYTPGYFGSYVGDDDVVVYGTGYAYPCWADTVWIGAPWTFGFDVGWAPGFEWGFGWGFGVGLGLGFWPGMLFHPWWGPAGWGWGHRNVAIRNYHETNLYRSSWGRNVVGNSWDRHVEGNRAALPGRSVPFGASVYAGHDGQVYRSTPQGEWERSTGSGWQHTAPTRDLSRENQGRTLGGSHWQTFRGGGGFHGGSLHGGGGRR
jgi:hypothetical protein